MSRFSTQPSSKSQPNTGRAARRLWLGLLVAAGAVCLVGDARDTLADTDQTITRVEEDWVVEVGTPDTNNSTPQIVTVISPLGSLNDTHSLFELNHSSLPDYSAGGMQLQCWKGDFSMDHHTFPDRGLMSTTGEVVSFTNSMSLSDGRLTYEVTDGSSTTWGKFGGQGHLKCTVSTSLRDLNHYSPSVSADNSRVAFAAHRVDRMVLSKVRYYSNGELIRTDSTERVVHSID